MTTEQPKERKPKGPPALASRILAIGVSTASMLGMVGAMAAADRTPAEQPVVATSTPARPTKVVVVLRADGSDRPATRVAAPAIARRAAPARAVTTSRAS